jgi:large subunit ribosomal protein L3
VLVPLRTAFGRTNGSEDWVAQENRAVAARFIFRYMKFLLATKSHMTQLFDEQGRAWAGTVLKTAPLTVTQVKSAEGADGYSAVQVGFGEQNPERLSKAVRGHLKDTSLNTLKEFRIENPADFEVGKEIGLDTFAVGDGVTVAGTSKGRGFAGVAKRHGFHGGRRTHGQKHSEREPGSIGGGGRAGGRVAKGLRMGGRMGNDRVTVENLKVLHIDAAKGEIIISGAIPGARGALVEVIAA